MSAPKEEIPDSSFGVLRGSGGYMGCPSPSEALAVAHRGYHASAGDHMGAGCQLSCCPVNSHHVRAHIPLLGPQRILGRPAGQVPRGGAGCFLLPSFC